MSQHKRRAPWQREIAANGFGPLPDESRTEHGARLWGEVSATVMARVPHSQLRCSTPSCVSPFTRVDLVGRYWDEIGISFAAKCDHHRTRGRVRDHEHLLTRESLERDGGMRWLLDWTRSVCPNNAERFVWWLKARRLYVPPWHEDDVL
jgi:hypothetical protein